MVPLQLKTKRTDSVDRYQARSVRFDLFLILAQTTNGINRLRRKQYCAALIYLIICNQSAELYLLSVLTKGK